jgi:hypothetical protein
MREDVLSERPPLAQQAEAEPDDASRALPVAQEPFAPRHPADLRPVVVSRKITPTGGRRSPQRLGSNS